MLKLGVHNRIPCEDINFYLVHMIANGLNNLLITIYYFVHKIG